MKITKADLKGQIEGYPIEIVERMVFNQTAQGNQEDVSVFQIKVDSNKVNGGFNWKETPEGTGFWAKVINQHFIDKEIYNRTASVYPPLEEQKIVAQGEHVYAVHPLTGKRAERVFVGIVDKAKYPYLVATEESYRNFVEKGNPLNVLLCSEIIPIVPTV